MSGLKRLIAEVHRRSLWQVLLVYLGGSWAVLEAVSVFSEQYRLPDWLFTAALLLLLFGLLAVVVLSFVPMVGMPERGGQATERPDLALESETVAARRRFLTWRNAVASFVASLAVWGIVATGWMLFGRGPDSEAAIAAVAGLAEVQELVGEARYAEAYARARELEAIVTNDSLREELWSAATRTATLTSEPSGAEVWMRPYDSAESEWEPLGRTPVEDVRLPLGLARLRLELDGYRPVYVARRPQWAWARTLKLDRLDSLPEGMVRVPGDEFEVFLPGLEHLALDLPDYFIDATEVTNRQFKRFVDAGAYSNPEYWEHPFVRDGREFPWEEAMAAFRDQTGRPGPSMWEVGTWPDGMAEHPVGGVSWYEAAAYARFAGMELPTLFHWYRAAWPHTSQFILPHSNFRSEGSAAVGTYDGISPFGAFDMAGNVREWTYNLTGEDRFILGGGWSDPEYMFTDANAQSPFDREPINGFRLMIPLDTTNLARAHEPIVRPHRDYFAEEPVPDDIFDVYRRLYAYDQTPLNAAVVAREAAEHWTREEISVDAAYGGERLTLFLYLPDDAEPPYQTIVYFPGSGAIYRDENPAADYFLFPFLIRSGRAVVFPVYKGTYERGTELKSDIQDETNSYREHVIQWSKDLGRSIDYIETRPDIAMDRLGYFGLSWGSAMAPVMLAVESRFRASVLLSGGLVLQPTQPEVDPFNFLPRVRVPTRMINVPNDYFYPLKTSQGPFYHFLAAEPKDSVLVEGGHVPPMNVVARWTLDWFEKYLGPVK